jgi:predicted nucleic acid-binding protein
VAVVLDSDAVIGFLDLDDALHRAAADAIGTLAREQALLASAITYAEVLTGARLGHHGEEHVDGFFAELISRIVPVDLDVAALAADLRARAPALRMPDALILATAESDRDTELIVTGDAAMAAVGDLKVEVRLLSKRGKRT